jgi:hypothetical protein
MVARRQLLKAGAAGYLAVDTAFPRERRRLRGSGGEQWLLSRRGRGRLAGVSPAPAMSLDRELSAAKARGDAARIVALLESVDVSPLLQAAGAALVVAAAAGAVIPGDLTGRVADALDERGWDGDAELSSLLRADPLGAAPVQWTVTVELDEVAELLQGDPELSEGGYIDLETGVTWPSSVLDTGDDDVPDPDADPDRYLFVPNEGSREAWRDMRDFTESLTDAGLRDQFQDAISGRGAFSRFRRLLDQHEELSSSWRIFESERSAGRARAWLADAGFAAVPPVPGNG